MGFEVTLLTNISLLTPDMINKLSKMYISKISATIFSLDENIHDSITNTKGSLKRVIENIKLIKKTNILLDVKTPVMKKNCDDLSRISEFCNINNVKHFVNLDIYEKRNGDQAPLGFEIDRNKKKELQRYSHQLKGYEPTPKKRENYFCEAVRRSLMIQVNGNVCVCPQYPHSFGNINSRSINSIWNDSEDLTKLRNLKWGDIDECWSCDKRDYCNRCAEHAKDFNAAITGKNIKTCMLASLNKDVYTSMTD